VHRVTNGVCQKCPHTRIRSERVLPIPRILTRQGNSDGLARDGWFGRSMYSPMSEGSGRFGSVGRSGSSRASPVVIKKESCDRPGHCDLHYGGATSLSPYFSPTLVRVRGLPPSTFIPRPFQHDVSRDVMTYVPSAADSHAALSDTLSNVKFVFDTLEICFAGLDAWRLYIASG